jgi:hypothetical protein
MDTTGAPEATTPKRRTWQKSGGQVTLLLTFLAAEDVPWWGLLIAGVVLTVADMILNPSTRLERPQE